MSDTFKNNSGELNKQLQGCQVSYTLNNSQPVSSTIIGDQPLFYMDYEIDSDDDDLFDAADINILEGEIDVLKKEIEKFDKFSEEFLQSSDQNFQLLLSDKETITKPSAKNIDISNLDIKIKDVLFQSRMAKKYIDFAEEHGVQIKMSSQIREAQYDRRAGVIFVNPNIEFTDQILLTVRELRRHWQHRQGVLINPLMFHPDNAVLVNRLQVADLTVSMIRIAWELQLSGVREVWERIENSSMADLGRAFARDAFMDFRTINNGQAATAVFESWFLSERCRYEDKKLVKQMLADYRGYVFDLEEAGQNITPALISALGAMPYGKNYLAVHADMIINDPVFTDIRDRSNANFLWFIKFERSFNEMEHELQTDFGQVTDGVRLTVFQEQDQDQNYDGRQTAEIVSLFSKSEPETKSSGKCTNKRTGQKSADIVYIRRWSGE